MKKVTEYVNGLLGESFDKMCDDIIERRNELAIKLFLIKAVTDDIPLKDVVRKYYIHEEPDRSLAETPTRYKYVDGRLLIGDKSMTTYSSRMILMERDIPYEEIKGYEDFKADVLNYLLKGIEI